ncbi:MAG: hypothetical protein JOY84_15480 [Curvibacter sp.]|nr:hypothetical protein [Curvibacter sp.]
MHSIQQTRLQSLLVRVPGSLDMPLVFMKICHLLITRMEVTLQSRPLFLLCTRSQREASALCAEIEALSSRIAINMGRLATALEIAEASTPPDPPPLAEIIRSIRIHADHVRASKDHVLNVLGRFLKADGPGAGPIVLTNAFNPAFSQGIRSELEALRCLVDQETRARFHCEEST